MICVIFQINIKKREYLKGCWTTSASFLDFFQNKVDSQIFIPLEVYTEVVTAYSYLTCNFNSVTKIYEFFFQ